MPNRRDIVKGLATSLALGLAGGKAGLAAPLAGLPALGGVEFLTPAMPEGRRLAMAFNRRTQKVPALRALCRTPQAVAEAVKWARDEGRRFAIRSSGHCFAGHSMHDQLVIDASALDRIDSDPASGRVTVGAGAFIGHVYEALAASAHGLPGGTYGSVCTAGLTLGGGIGFMARSAGLLCDRLTEIELVDAGGTIVRASGAENSDLFWACRGGGGGGFGIATEMRFRTVAVPERLIIYVFIAVAFAQAVRIVGEWPHWTEELGRETTTHLLLSRHSADKCLIALTGQSTLPRPRLLRALSALLGPENPIGDNALVDYYSSRGAALEGGWDEILVPIDFLSECDYVDKPPPPAVVGELIETLKRLPPGFVKITFEALGGAVGDVGPDETAYPHRAATCLAEYRCDLRDASQADAGRAAIREVRAILKPHVTGGAYVNYPDPELDNWAEAYWGANLPRLVAIKRKWDPDNLFRHAQSVPLA